MKGSNLEMAMGVQLLQAHERADRLVSLISHMAWCAECSDSTYLHCDVARCILNEMEPGDLPPHLMPVDPSV